MIFLASVFTPHALLLTPCLSKSTYLLILSMYAGIPSSSTPNDLRQWLLDNNLEALYGSLKDQVDDLQELLEASREDLISVAMQLGLHRVCTTTPVTMLWLHLNAHGWRLQLNVCVVVCLRWHHSVTHLHMQWHIIDVYVMGKLFAYHASMCVSLTLQCFTEGNQMDKIL